MFWIWGCVKREQDDTFRQWVHVLVKKGANSDEEIEQRSKLDAARNKSAAIQERLEEQQTEINEADAKAAKNMSKIRHTGFFVKTEKKEVNGVQKEVWTTIDGGQESRGTEERKVKGEMKTVTKYDEQVAAVQQGEKIYDPETNTLQAINPDGSRKYTPKWLLGWINVGQLIKD